MDIINWIISHIDDAALIVAAIGAILFLIKKGQGKILKQILFGLVTEAEQLYGNGTGVLKYAAVADWIYEKIPSALRVLFTAKDLEKMIEAALTEAKEKWKENINLQNYIGTDAKTEDQETTTVDTKTE